MRPLRFTYLCINAHTLEPELIPLLCCPAFILLTWERETCILSPLVDGVVGTYECTDLVILFLGTVLHIFQDESVQINK